MNRLWLIVACMATAAISEAAPNVEWIRQFGTASNNEGTSDIAIDGNDDVYIVGRMDRDFDGNVMAGGNDLLLTKYSSTGVRLWTDLIGTASSDGGRGVSVDSFGNAYVTGYTKGNYTGVPRKNDAVENMYPNSILLAKYSTTGVRQWVRQLGSPSSDSGSDISVDSSGNSYVTGRTEGNIDANSGAADSDAFLAKYDTDGTKLWVRQFGTASGDSGSGVSLDSFGNAYVTGYTSGRFGTNDYADAGGMFVAKYDDSGVQLWVRQMNSVSGNAISVDGIGNAYITGAIGVDMLLTKYDPDGNNLWVRSIGSQGGGSGMDVSVDSLGSAYIIGHTFGTIGNYTNAGGHDLGIAKYDTDGNREWVKQLGTEQCEHGYGIVINDLGNVFLTGTTGGDFGGNINAGGADMFVMKLSHSPEPSTAVMLMIALGCLLWSRRRTNERTVCRG